MRSKPKPRLTRAAISILSGILGLLAVLGLLGHAFGQSETASTKRAPAFTLKDTQDNAVKLADFAGKPLVISFVVTWDQPSLKQIAILSDLRKEHGETDLAILAVAIEQTDKQTTKTYVEQQHPSFPFLVADYPTIVAFGGLTAVPTTFVIDTDQNIVQRHEEVTEKKVLEAELKMVPKQ
jgi:peroxiredoxin